ncbi:MAG TPA: hypothetical protein PK006_07155 [Saprospiraceae bacterium]|nr:hypothetical protein [Saprospiraceae bacterium]
MLKSFALLVCFGFVYSLSAQSNGSVNASGLLQVNNGPWQTEFRIDLSSAPVASDESLYRQYLGKYISALGSNATWRFDAPARVAYLKVERSNSLMPGDLNAEKLNYFLKSVYEN